MATLHFTGAPPAAPRKPYLRFVGCWSPGPAFVGTQTQAWVLDAWIMGWEPGLAGQTWRRNILQTKNGLGEIRSHSNKHLG